MKTQSIGEVICHLRKEKGMTQADLAEKMNVSEQAVSKWERNIAYPDITTLSKLTEILETSVDSLLKCEIKRTPKTSGMHQAAEMAPLAVALAMGVCLIVTSVLNAIDLQSGLTLAGVGLVGTALYLFRRRFPN